jgi:hypothetical protein
VTYTTVSNCLRWARVLYLRRLRAWMAAGCKVGQEPYILIRPSRNRPRWLPHVLVGKLDEDGRISPVSLKPLVPTDEPWWRAWRHTWFRGVPTEGDRPEPWAPTQPTEPVELDEAPGSS